MPFLSKKEGKIPSLSPGNCFSSHPVRPRDAVAALVSHGPAYGPWTRQRTGVQLHGVLDLGSEKHRVSPWKQ